MPSNERNDNPGEPKRSTRREGFLPINTNTFDRVFISVVCFIAIQLLWFRFLEASLSIYFATVISLALAYVIIRWG